MPSKYNIEAYPDLNEYELFLPAGAFAETTPRDNCFSAAIAMASGTLLLSAVPLIANKQINNISVAFGTTAAITPTHSWAGLFDAFGNLLAVSADRAAGAIAANATIVFPLTTPYVPNDFGYGYIGVLVAAATPPTLNGAATTVLFTSPFLSCTGTAAQTIPPVPGAFQSTLANNPSARFYANLS